MRRKGTRRSIFISIMVFILVTLPFSALVVPFYGSGGNITLASVSGETSDDLFGWNVSGAGDLNDDGYSDFIVGAPGYDNQRGRAYVFFGGPGFTGSYSADSADVTINGSAQGDRFGWDVSGGGDINDDGYDDVVIGAPGDGSETGAVYILFGNDPIPNFLEEGDLDVMIKGENPGDEFGSSVSIAGDVNSDGFSDVIVGSPGWSAGTGCAYLFSGMDPMISSMTTGDSTLTLYGENPGHRFGHSVSGAVDVNNDNFDDVIVGAPGIDRSYVYFGGDPMNSWVQTTQGDFDSGVKVHSITDISGELTLDTFYDIKAMMAYNGSYSNIPRIRAWNQTEWGNWSDTGAPYIDQNYWFDLESGTTRKNEKILGVLDDGLDLNIHVWDGLTWGPILEIIDADLMNLKSFDIVYESQSGDAMVAYFNANSGDLFPKYRIWNGTAWGPELDSLEVGSGAIYWLALASNPNSDEILMVTLDGNYDLWAQVWDGDSWGYNISIETDASERNYQCYDVGYESQSGYGFIAWADNTFNLRYRRWTGNWTVPEASWGLSPGITRFVRLASEPNSNYILAARLDDSSEIAARVWNGTSWGLSKVVTFSPKINSRACFDVAWESKSEKEGIIVYGEPNEAPMYRNVTGNEINDTESTTLDPNPGSGDPNWIVLKSDPQSDDIMMMYMVFDPFGIDDIGVQMWNGSNWTFGQNVEEGSKVVNGQRFDLSYTDTSGYLISSSFDGDINLSWGRVHWKDDTPPGTNIRIRTRTSSDDVIWSQWSSWYTDGDRITSPTDRYIQYQAWLETTNLTARPVLYDITIELNRPDVVIIGTSGESLGWSVSGLGDLEGDDHDDVIIGAPHNNSDQGSAYILLGEYLTSESLGDRTIDFTNGDVANYTLVGESPGDLFGYSVSSAGYFNNDGMLDVMIGAPRANSGGTIYVFFGGPTQPPLIPASLNDFFYEGENTSDDLGFSVALAGNVDNDTAGYQEILVGAPLHDSGGNADSGRAYLLHMFNQPDLLIQGNGDGLYQDLPSGLQVVQTIIEANTNASWGIIIENDGVLNDTFDISITPTMLGGWTWELRDNLTWGIVTSGETLVMGPGESREYTLDIFAPLTAVHDEESEVMISVTSQNDSTRSDSIKANAKVRDVTPPGIDDTTSDSLTTDDPFSFTSIVTDNILLDKVYVEFWFNTTEGETPHFNVSMIDLGGGIFVHDNLTPSNSIGLFYFISAVDTSINWNKTNVTNLGILDNDPPEIDDIKIMPKNPVIGDPMNISANLTDDFGVDTVQIDINYPDGSWITMDMLKGPGDSWYYENVFLEPGIYNYTIRTNDTNGKENQTAVMQFNMGVPPPSLDYIQIRSEPNNQGVIIDNMEYDRDETDIFYAAGYNHTYGYIGEVEVTWGSTNSNAGSVNPTSGTSTNFTAINAGSGSVFAIYNAGIQNSTAFEIIISSLPEIIREIPDIVLEEDFGARLVDLTSYAYHPQTPQTLKWDIQGIDSIILNVSGLNKKGNHGITLISQENKNGNMHVQYFLIDEDGNSASQWAWINITPKNDPPVIKGCPDLWVRYDVPYSFDYTPYISDIDNPLSQLTLTVDDSDYVTVDGFVATYTYPEEMLGEEVFVKLSVSDGDLVGNYLIKVNIISNYPPDIVAQLPDVTLYENEISYSVFDLNDFFSDKEGDRLTFFVSQSYVTITINENGTVDFSAPEDWSGSQRVTFRAVDIIGGMVEQTISVSVIPVNDPPVIGPLNDLSIHHDYPYQLDLVWYISDKDNPLDELVISTNYPDNITVNGTVLILVFPKVWNGQDIPYTIPLVIYVSDGFYNVTRAITVTVTDNYPPRIIRPLEDIFLYEDTSFIGAFDLDEHFYDVDGDTIFYTTGNRSIRVVINGDNTVDFTPEPDWFGSELILIRGTDDIGAYLEDLILVTVIPVNDPPVILEIPELTIVYETKWPFDITDYISDKDNKIDDLNITVDSPYAKVVGQVLLFYYPKNVKSDTILVTVSDGELNDTVTISVKVTAPSLPPEEPPILWFGIIILLAALLFIALITRIARYRLAEVFLITKSGMLIEHRGKTKDDEKDKDIVASMFVAVQSFIKDAFAEEDSEFLKRMDYGDKTVLIIMGESVLLTAFIKGQESKKFLGEMKGFIQYLEKRYEGAIEMWDGNYDNLPDIGDVLESFFNGTFKRDYLRETQAKTKESKVEVEVEEVPDKELEEKLEDFEKDLDETDAKEQLEELEEILDEKGEGEDLEDHLDDYLEEGPDKDND